MNIADGITVYTFNTAATLSAYDGELEGRLSAYYENYFHTPSYQSGTWDGKYHFLKLSKMTFPAGLVHVVEEYCREKGIQCRVVDKRIRPFAIPGDLRVAPDILSGITLRPNQVEAAETAVKATRGVVEMPTGSGKTEVAAAIIKTIAGLAGRPSKTLFLVHTRDLLRQTQRRFSDRLGAAVGAFGDSEFDIDPPVVVATVQTINNLFKSDKGLCESFLKLFETIILDECHHASADSWYRIGMFAGNAYFRYGLSGTALRRDILSNMRMMAIVGGPIYQIKTADLIQRGDLCDIEIEMVQNPEVVTGAYAGVYHAGIVSSRARNGAVVDIARREFAAGRRVMVLIRMIEHGEILSAALEGEGVPCTFLSGRDSSQARADAKAAFDAGGKFVLISSVIFSEGVDIPNVNTIIVAAGGKSEVRAIQQVGRGLRKKGDRSSLKVYDFIDSSKYLRAHSLKRAGVYKKEGFLREAT